MIRIISGELKGKRIAAPKKFQVRPTTDFAKEAIFSILSNSYEWENSSFLDLFGGIGSISYECISRGVKDCTIVEIHPEHIKFIRSSAQALNIENRLTIVKKDVFQFLNQNIKKYTIIFADPPFDFTKEKYEELVNTIFTKNQLSENGKIIIEHSIKINLEDNKYFFEARKYGSTKFSFFNYP